MKDAVVTEKVKQNIYFSFLCNSTNARVSRFQNAEKAAHLKFISMNFHRMSGDDST